MDPAASPSGPQLHRTLGPWMIWGLGVGYVISGEYFGWNLGLPAGGPWGMLVATGLVTLLYVCFVLTYAEVASAIPRAGGAFVYANRTLGPDLGLLAGAAQAIELVFAPPAIAAAIGAYFHMLMPWVPAMAVAVVAYLAFTTLNVRGVRSSAIFELVVTLLAVAELLVFCGLTLPSFSWSAFTLDAPALSAGGVFAALPFAIWFYLAIEGVANVAEEARDPRRDIPRGFGLAMATLVILALATFFGAVGVAGWKAVVFPAGGTEPSDSPLPLALERVVGAAHPLYHLLVGVGLFGLVASFHGIILAAGRATFESGRVGYAPRALGRVSPGRGTPAVALCANAAIGLAALATGRTAEIITLSVFGAVTLYLLATLSYFRLRTAEPGLERPFRTPGHPWVPGLALLLSLGALGVLAVTFTTLALIYATLLGGAWLAWRILVSPEVRRGAREDHGR